MLIKRRLLDLERDYDRLLPMQRQSWQINFPDQVFHEARFRLSLHAAAKRNEVFVYELGDELVGWLWLDLSLIRSVHIRHIQVAQAHWGKGLGRQIMEDAIAFCAERGCQLITLNVTKSNTRAVALYQGLGFVVAKDKGDRQYMELRLPRTHKDGPKE